MSRSSGQGVLYGKCNRIIGLFGPKPYQRPYFYLVPKVRGGALLIWHMTVFGYYSTSASKYRTAEEVVNIEHLLVDAENQCTGTVILAEISRFARYGPKF